MTPIEEEEFLKECDVLRRKIKQVSFTISHRIRGPITTLMGLLDLLKVASLSDEERDVIFLHIHNTVDELDKISRHLSDYLNGEGHRN